MSNLWHNVTFDLCCGTNGTTCAVDMISGERKTVAVSNLYMSFATLRAWSSSIINGLYLSVMDVMAGRIQNGTRYIRPVAYIFQPNYLWGDNI